MVLVDTSVWIDFFKGKSDAQNLSQLIESDEVVLHPFTRICQNNSMYNLVI